MKKITKKERSEFFRPYFFFYCIVFGRGSDRNAAAFSVGSVRLSALPAPSAWLRRGTMGGTAGERALLRRAFPRSVNSPFFRAGNRRRRQRDRRSCKPTPDRVRFFPFPNRKFFSVWRSTPRQVGSGEAPFPFATPLTVRKIALPCTNYRHKLS